MINQLVLESLTNKKLRFIIHEHHAVKAGLHYDLRLEHNNKLISWATRKLPELVNNPNHQKILLIKQPDHEMDWVDFKGEIEEGYGKGKVNIWDNGIYDLIYWSDNKIIVKFNGKKINSKYTIVKPSTFDDKPTHYLMFKS